MDRFFILAATDCQRLSYNSPNKVSQVVSSITTVNMPAFIVAFVNSFLFHRMRYTILSFQSAFPVLFFFNMVHLGRQNENPR